MATARDVAAAILQRSESVDQMKLQKLLYYCQGWNLAWTGRPLFTDTVEAWRYGPMVDAVYQDYKGFGDEPIEAPASGDAERLTEDELHVVTSVLARYGKLSGTTLAEMTHNDHAWREAWGERGEYDRGRQTIKTDRIVTSFRRGSFGHPKQRGTVDPIDERLQRAAEGDSSAIAEILSSA